MRIPLRTPQDGAVSAQALSPTCNLCRWCSGACKHHQSTARKAASRSLSVGPAIVRDFRQDVVSVFKWNGQCASQPPCRGWPGAVLGCLAVTRKAPHRTVRSTLASAVAAGTCSAASAASSDGAAADASGALANSGANGGPAASNSCKPSGG